MEFFCRRNHISFRKSLAGLAFILPVLISLSSLFTCTKDEPRLMKVLNDKVDEISVSTAKIHTTVVDIGEGVDQFGQCWSKWENPTLDSCENFTSRGPINKTGVFVDIIAGMNAGSQYYIKAYLQKGNDIVYSNPLDFSTLAATGPVVNTGNIRHILSGSLIVDGTIESVGLTATGITGHGHCRSHTTALPTTNDTLTNLGPRETTGTFTSILEDLKPNTLYYLRAYATNDGGTNYGETKEVFITGNELIEVTTAEVTEITTSSCKCGGNVYSEGTSPVTARGVCWSSSRDPLSSEHRTFNDSGPGPFVSSVAGLMHNTVYYIVAYATNSTGTRGGQVRTFKTDCIPSVPSLTTIEETNVTRNSATSGGNNINDGCATITAKGVCWSSVHHDPTIADPHSNDGTGTDDFASSLTELTASTLYYVRAYARNSIGYGYGPEISIITNEVTTSPTVVTTFPSNIEASSASSGGEITDDGGETITAKGVCWGKTTIPTIENDYTTNEGEGKSSFVSEMASLQPLTAYYVRAYATNVNGTSYGEEYGFETGFECRTRVRDKYDNKTYLTVQIGSQCWMAENLNVGVRIDGTTLPADNGIYEKHCYDNLESNCNIYGGLYRWDEMMQYTTEESPQGICPYGFHIPSDNEWKILEMTIGMSSTDADALDWRGTTEGGELKFTGTTFWLTPNTGATNEWGFGALPAGGMDGSGGFGYMGTFAHYWTSTTWVMQSLYRYLSYNSAQIRRIDGNRTYGTAVRCVR